MDPLPEQFVRTIQGLHGDEGIDWLDRLPVLIAVFERRWSITVQPPFSNLSYNYLAPAVRDGGQEVVLKLGVPNPELMSEIDALRCYDGSGCVRLLADARAEGALLLERLQPGRPLSGHIDDRQATSIAAGVMRQLWCPLPDENAFPSVAKWAAGLGRLRHRFDGATGPLPEVLVSRAEGQFRELLGSMAEPVLLHGDLHHDNILAAARQPWLAIDPKGLSGEPAYEVGALLRNPFPQLLSMDEPRRILARRVDQLADELGFERERLVGWGFAQAVLSAWWCLEDNVPGLDYGIAIAELLARL